MPAKQDATASGAQARWSPPAGFCSASPILLSARSGARLETAEMLVVARKRVQAGQRVIFLSLAEHRAKLFALAWQRNGQPPGGLR